jgi:hypothetical protein
MKYLSVIGLFITLLTLLFFPSLAYIPSIGMALVYGIKIIQNQQNNEIFNNLTLLTIWSIAILISFN